jgi:hypothetical protein
VIVVLLFPFIVVYLLYLMLWHAGSLLARAAGRPGHRAPAPGSPVILDGRLRAGDPA